MNAQYFILHGRYAPMVAGRNSANPWSDDVMAGEAWERMTFGGVQVSDDLDFCDYGETSWYYPGIILRYLCPRVVYHLENFYGR